MRVKSLDDGEIDVARDSVTSWKARLRGPVLEPGDSAYEDSRTVWNSMINRRPAIVARCLGAPDVIECVRFAREHNLLTAAHRAGSLTPDLSTALYETLDELARRGQQAGVVRADLAADDLPRLIAMLHSVLFTMDSASDGWRRYVALMLDAIAVDKQRSLPPAAELRYGVSSGWPI